MEDILLELIKEIKNISPCETCGATFDGNFVCSCCGKKNEIAAKLMERLRILINSYYDTLEVPVHTQNKVLNELFALMMKGYETECISQILFKTDYLMYVNDTDAQIIEKLDKKEKLSVEDYDFIASLLALDCYDSCALNYCNVILKALITKEFTIDQERFEAIIILLVKEIRKTFIGWTKPSCVIERLDNKTLGYNNGGEASLERELVTKFLNGDIAPLLCTIFHENIHSKQKFRIIKNTLSPLDMLELKDYILGNSIEGYVDVNYRLLSDEVEAYGFEKKEVRDYLQGLGIEITGDLKDSLDDSQEGLDFPLGRMVEGKSYNVFTLFDDFIKSNPDLLRRYPVLTVEYKVVNEQVFPKTEEELGFDREKNVLDNKKNEIAYIDYLLHVKTSPKYYRSM